MLEIESCSPEAGSMTRKATRAKSDKNGWLEILQRVQCLWDRISAAFLNVLCLASLVLLYLCKSFLLAVLYLLIPAISQLCTYLVALSSYLYIRLIAFMRQQRLSSGRKQHRTGLKTSTIPSAVEQITCSMKGELIEGTGVDINGHVCRDIVATKHDKTSATPTTQLEQQMINIGLKCCSNSKSTPSSMPEHTDPGSAVSPSVFSLLPATAPAEIPASPLSSSSAKITCGSAFHWGSSPGVYGQSNARYEAINSIQEADCSCRTASISASSTQRREQRKPRTTYGSKYVTYSPDALLLAEISVGKAQLRPRTHTHER